MRRLFLLLLLTLAIASPAIAQNTLVSATITDTGGQAWVSGTYTFTSEAYPSIAIISGTLDSTGSFTSISFPTNNVTAGVGGRWRARICPAVTAPCYGISVTVPGGSTLSLTSVLTPPAITIDALKPPPTTAYTDSEIINSVQGSRYFNVTDGTEHVCKALPCSANWQSSISNGGGSLQGTWTGGPTATIANSPTGVTEAGNTVTVTNTAPCTFAQNQPIRISGVGVAGYNGDFTAHTACAGSTFTYIDQYASLANSGGGTAVGAPIFNTPVNISGLLKTGTGLSSLVPNGQNVENVCGSVASPFVGDTGSVQNVIPCTHSLMYYATPVTANGFGNSVHRTDIITATGIDVRSPLGEYHNAQCNSTNTGGFATSNATNCLASVGVTNGNGQVGQTASDFVAQCGFAGVGVQLCQANENLVNTGRAGGWQHSYFNTWSPLNAATIQSGSQNISSYFFAASSAAGKSALIGEYITDVLNAGHLVTHGATQRPDTGYWSGGATTAGFRSSCAPVYSTNGGSTPNYGSDCPTYGFLGEENAVTNGNSQQLALISTNASGTAATIASSPTGLVQSDFTVNVTTTAPCSFTTGQPIAISGAGNALYNGNFRVLSPGCNGGSTFTYYNASNGPGSTTATISSLSESGSTVTATMSATCTFATGMTVNVQPPIPNLNARTTDTGYYGFFTVLTPGCNGGSSFTYTNAVTGLGALGAVGTVESYLPPSGAGTVTGGTQQTWAVQHTPDKILHWTYCDTSFACAGSDQLTYQACPGIGSTFCGVGVHDSGAQRFRMGYSNTSITGTKIVPIQMQYFSGGDLQIGSRSTAVSTIQFFTSPDAGTTGLVERLRLNSDGGIRIPEVAAPAAASGADICYGDSTAHAIKCSYNNGSFLNLVQTPAVGTVRSSLLISDQGTACANGNIALSAGWGTTAATTNARGQGQTCEWTITASGTGQAASPTITWTVPTALPSANVLCEGSVKGGTQATPSTIDHTTLSATAPIFTYNGTPTAAATLFVLLRCGP